VPRKRMIDPSFWRDEKISKCSCMERLLFIGLWTFAEDSGAGRASPLLIKADIFPYDTLREADIQKSLQKLSELGLINLYERTGQQYYFVTNFKKHQTINKPSQCYLPTPLPEDYRSTPVVVTSEDKEKIKEKEVKLREENECAESAGGSAPPVIFLTLNTGEEYPIYKKQTDEWSELYPSVDVMQELRNMRGWLIANPSKRKTKSGISRFIVSWLSREQDKGRVTTPVKAKKYTAASDYEPPEPSVGELERLKRFYASLEAIDD